MKIPAEKMAQRIKNQKNTKSKSKIKLKKAVKKAPVKKVAVAPTRPKNVKTPVKKVIKKNSKPAVVKAKEAKRPAPIVVKGRKSSLPAKNADKITPVKPGKTNHVLAKQPASSSKKASKVVAEPIVTLSQEEINKLPTIKRPGAGQVQQRRAPGKMQKKVFRSEMIFPNQLKETPLAKAKNKSEPKGKFELEFLVKSSPTLLFDFLATPSGLSEWFADDVDIRNEEFTFHWDGQVQRAKLLAYKQDHLLRLRWVDKNEDFYFEFRIDHDDLTGDVTLIITDFGESEDDLRTSKLLWESQVHKLLKVLGAY
jgi:uncharacterized protein YndB with AHSA1/START domain